MMNRVKMDTLKRLASEVNTNLQFAGSYVRETNDFKYIRWMSMYYKLNKRRQKMNKSKRMDIFDIGTTLIAHDGDAKVTFTNDEVIIKISNVVVRDELERQDD